MRGNAFPLLLDHDRSRYKHVHVVHVVHVVHATVILSDRLHKGVTVAVLGSRRHRKGEGRLPGLCPGCPALLPASTRRSRPAACFPACVQILPWATESLVASTRRASCVRSAVRTAGPTRATRRLTWGLSSSATPSAAPRTARALCSRKCAPCRAPACSIPVLHRAC